MTEFEEKNSRAVPGESQPRGTWLTMLGFLILWIASLAFILEVYNLTVVKDFQVDFDPSFEILVAVFCFLMTMSGALLLWKGLRARLFHPSRKADRNVNMALLACAILLALVSISAVFVYGSNRAFLKQQSPYVRPAPRPDYTLGEFPTPAALQPTPTYDPSGRYLAGSLLGSIDHLRVGSIRINTSMDNTVVNSIQFDVQRVECLVEQNGAPVPFAVDDSSTWVYGPLPVKDGRFYADQDMGVVIGKIMPEDSMTGTVYLVYRDPQSGQICDLGTFEFNAFVIER